MRRPLLTSAAVVLATALASACNGRTADGALAPPATPTSSSPTFPSPLSSSVPPPSPAAPSPAAPSTAPTPVVEQGDGRLVVVEGTSAVSGPGEPTSYVVEVEGGLGIDPVAFAREVDRVLADPRSWGGGGRRALQRVDGREPGFRVVLASPHLTDRLCAPLQTNGYFSCGNGSRAVLNSARWLQGAPSYDGALGPYREYLVNHEVGHVLGRGHESCPGPGQLAPVMLQQTKGLAGCARNSWPYP